MPLKVLFPIKKCSGHIHQRASVHWAFLHPKINISQPEEKTLIDVGVDKAAVLRCHQDFWS